jgi:dTDP-4-dehydrorhamnose reductase
MKILVTGCNGLLGQKLVQYAPRNTTLFGIDLHETCYTELSHYKVVDLGDLAATRELVNNLQPDWILNAAAFTDVDGAEKMRELCRRVNVTSVENLALACKESGAKLAHVSTDYIFDGNHGPYRETDAPNPIGYYGETKLAGEKALQNSSIEFVIARTMVLYGHGKNVRPNFVTWLVDKLRNGQTVRIVTDQYGNTTLVDELAEGIWKMVNCNSRGVYHIAGCEVTDRYTFAVTIALVFGLATDLIMPITTDQLAQQAPRPMRSGLIVDKAINELGLHLSDVEAGLRRFKTLWDVPAC